MKCYVCGQDINHVKAAVTDLNDRVRHNTCPEVLLVQGEVIAKQIDEKKDDNDKGKEKKHEKPPKFWK